MIARDILDNIFLAFNHVDCSEREWLNTSRLKPQSGFKDAKYIRVADSVHVCWLRIPERSSMFQAKCPKQLRLFCSTRIDLFTSRLTARSSLYPKPQVAPRLQKSELADHSIIRNTSKASLIKLHVAIDCGRRLVGYPLPRNHSRKATTVREIYLQELKRRDTR